MRPFALKLLAFLGLNIAIFAALLHWYPTMRSQGFFGEIVDKEAMARATPSPRILLVGGSNLVFGVDSAALAQALGRPTVNLGLSVALGRQFILRQAATHVRRGDLVVLALEPQTFWDGTGHAYALAATLESSPDTARFLAFPQWKALLDESFDYFGLVARSSLRDLLIFLTHRGARPGSSRLHLSHFRDGFNAHGDFVAHHSESSQVFDERRQYPPIPAARIRAVGEELAAFVVASREQGAEVCYEFTRLPASTAVAYAPELTAIDATLSTVPHLVVLNHPADIPYPRELFYDTINHLGKIGGERRTRELIAALHAHGW